MSSKTKTELEAENRLLQREITLLCDQVSMLLDELDAEINASQIIKSAHEDDLQKLSQLSSGRVQREWAALERRKYLQLRYAKHRKKHSKTKSRKKANNDLAEKFGEKHRLKVESDGKPGRQLIAICKD
jgi:hypothetical protein